MSLPDALVRARSHLAFPLDYPTLKEARGAAERIAPYAGVLKIGLELFVREGPEAVRALQGLGCDLFLDLKLHDISQTVENAVANVCRLGVRYLTLHCSGGPGMLQAAAERAHRENTGLCLLGVTVLTSLDQADLRAVGVEASASTQVERLARLARDAGLGGLVCSAHEVAAVRQIVGPEPTLVTPGIRPAGAAAGDQKRVGSPADAMRSGSSLLVIGRPIRDAADPPRAAADILAEIASA